MDANQSADTVACPEKTGIALSPEEEAARQDFFSSQSANLSRGSYPLPAIKRGISALTLRSADTKRMMTEGYDGWEDVSRDFSDFLRKEKPAKNFKAAEVRVYQIRISSRRRYRLASAFLIPETGPVTPDDIGCLLDFFKKGYRCSETLHWFYTIGTAADFDSSCAALPDPTVFLCKRSSPGVWLFKTPDLSSCGPVTREFLRHILPGTGYTNAIRMLIRGSSSMPAWDRELDGNITRTALKEKLGGVPDGFDIFDPVMDAALNDLFRPGGYAKAKAPKKPKADDLKEDAVFLVADGLPKGAKECHCWTPPFVSVKRRYIALCVSVLLLWALSFLLFQVLKVKAPTYFTAGLSAGSSVLAYLRTKAMLACKLGVSL